MDQHSRQGIKAVAFLVVGLFLSDPVEADLVYSIGNSLTYDTVPQRLEGDVAYHIDCGKSLQYIFDNPLSPCVSTSSIWPHALAEKQYDWVTVQPFTGTTLAQDVSVISHWMLLQPNATFVVHTGWSYHAKHETDYHSGNPSDSMVHSPEYFQDLIESLLAENPGRKIVSTKAIDILDAIYHDIETGKAPYSELADLYRDEIHMTLADGRYLMHNAMRQALGQSFSDVGFESVNEETKAYLNAKISAVTSVPEPPGFFLCGAVLGCAFLGRLIKRRTPLSRCSERILLRSLKGRQYAE